MKQEKRQYQGSITVLYIICTQGWEKCLRYLTQFAEFKSFYTAVYVADALQAVESAQAIKDEGSRDTDGAIARIDLEKSTRLVCNNWQRLKSYIEQAYGKGKEKALLNSAGWELYHNAAANNWSDLQELIKAANSFIVAHEQKLFTDGYMTAAFAAKFKTDSEVCVQLCENYLELLRNKSVLAEEKLAANNAIYANLISMYSDAQLIFTNKVIKRQFTFSASRILIEGHGAGSIRGKITDAGTGKPVGDVQVTVVNERQSAASNKKGGYKIARIAAGTYTLHFAKAGFAPVTMEVTVKTSTAATCNRSVAEIESQMKAA